MDNIKLAASVGSKESETFSTLNRIDTKLESLQNILMPIICDKPNSTPEKVSSTELANRLSSIEDKITHLIDTVEL
jgi:hypothetical protein